jgi:hypothetical protein
VQRGLVDYYQRSGEIPDSLAAAGLPERLPGGATLELNTDGMVLQLQHGELSLQLVPRKGEGGAINWVCQAGEGTPVAVLPPSCR